MKKIIYLFAILLALLPAISADIVVDQIKGDVRVKLRKSLKFSKLRKGDKLAHGDWIKTKAGAMVHIKFHDESVILIKENARFRIEDTKTKTEINFSQKKGEIAEFLIGINPVFKLKKKTYTIKTPAVVVGVRGTVFWGLSDKKLTSTYASFENEISISAQGITKILKPGKKIQTLFGEAPGDIVDANIPLDYIDTFKVEGSIQGMKKRLSP